MDGSSTIFLVNYWAGVSSKMKVTFNIAEDVCWNEWDIIEVRTYGEQK